MDIRMYFHLLCNYLQTNPFSTDHPPLHNTPKINNDSKPFSFPTVELFHLDINIDVTEKKKDISGPW